MDIQKIERKIKGIALIIMILAGVCRAEYKFTPYIMETPDGKDIEICTRMMGFVDEDEYLDFLGVVAGQNYIFWGNNYSDKIQYENTLLPATGPLADIDRDGKVDIVFDEETTDKNNVYVKYNLGNREFSDPVLILSIPTNEEWGRLFPEILDVDGDGNLDLIFYHPVDDCFTNIYWGDMNNEFSPDRHTNYYASRIMAYPWCDVNNDGKMDFITGNPVFTFEARRVFVQQEDKTFSQVSTLPNAIKTRQVVDVNGDGNLDIVGDFQDGLVDRFVVLPGKGDGTFDTPVELFSEQGDGDDGTDYLSFSLCLCAPSDFEGDGKTDLVITRRYKSNYKQYLLTIDKDLNYQLTDLNQSIDGAVTSFEDFNGDGYPDFTTSGADGWIMYFGSEAEDDDPLPPPPAPPSGGGGGGGCFIATACFGSYDHPFVKVLRQFRDECLLTNKVGSAFVRWYYRHSPAGAEFLNKYVVLKVPVLICLLPVVLGAFLLLHPYLIVCVVGLWGVVKKENYYGIVDNKKK